MAGNIPLTRGILKRIDDAIKEIGETRRSISMAIGNSQDYIRSLNRQFDEGKQHNISSEVITKIANEVKRPPEFLIEGRENGSAASPALGITRTTSFGGGLAVTGKVATGIWIETAVAVQETAAVEVPIDPRYPANTQYGVMVNGQSINRVAQEGDYLIVVHNHLSPRSGDLVIVLRTRNGMREMTAKRFIQLEKSIELRNDSTDPRYTDTIAYPQDTDDHIEIRGVVVGVWRPMI